MDTHARAQTRPQTHACMRACTHKDKTSNFHKFRVFDGAFFGESILEAIARFPRLCFKISWGVWAELNSHIIGWMWRYYEAVCTRFFVPSGLSLVDIILQLVTQLPQWYRIDRSIPS